AEDEPRPRPGGRDGGLVDRRRDQRRGAAGDGLIPELVANSSWARRIAIDPSPTAEATRFTEPWRTSPAAKTPGRLVSSEKGRRSSGQDPSPSSSGPVSTKPLSPSAISGGSQSVFGRAPIIRKRPSETTSSSPSAERRVSRASQPSSPAPPPTTSVPKRT